MGPGARRPASGRHDNTTPSRKGVQFDMRFRFLRLFAVALVTLGIAAAPALAVPATVRIVGDTVNSTTTVQTPAGDVFAGCPGSSGGGALNVATNGNWDKQMYVSTILGETHDYSNSDYWAFWVNGAYSQVGACQYTVQAGDELLFYVQKDGPGFVGTIYPLYLSGVPSTATVGQPFTVTVRRHVSDGTTTTPTPIAVACSCTVPAVGITSVATPSAPVVAVAPPPDTVAPAIGVGVVVVPSLT
jgi:hypothetical protein